VRLSKNLGEIKYSIIATDYRLMDRKVFLLWFFAKKMAGKKIVTS